MCYPVPGPRCSAHAFAEFVDAETRYVNCVDPSLKLILGAKLEEKRTIYETTPKGQNELRRAADATDGVERDELLLRMQKGAATRNKQLQEYHHMVKNKKSSFVNSVEDKGYIKGRYQDACGIAAIFLTTRFPDEDFHASDLHTVISATRKVFVVAEKYVADWDKVHFSETEGYVSEDIILQKIFKESLNLSTPSPYNESLMFSWFVNKLKLEGYTDVAAVNRKTEDVIVLPIEQLHNLYSIKFRLKKRVGGSTSYRGNVADLTQYIVGTVFEEGKILQPAKTYKTVIYGVPPQAKKDCVLSEEIFLSWRPPSEGEEGYFEVRRRHVSSQFDVTVVLTRERDIEVSGIKTKKTVNLTDEKAGTVEESPKFASETIEVDLENNSPVHDEEQEDFEEAVEPVEVNENLYSEDDEYTQLESFTEDEYTQDEFSQAEPEEPKTSSHTPKSNIWF